MDIKSWKIMLAVDDYGSFTRVGAELGYTQSGITQTMKNLEKKVGFPLYIKDHQAVQFTGFQRLSENSSRNIRISSSRLSKGLKENLPTGFRNDV